MNSSPGPPDAPDAPDAAVVDSVEAAALFLRQGRNVVLVVDPDAGQVLRPAEGPGRLAIFVGKLDDPAVRAAAEEMAGELFSSG